MAHELLKKRDLTAVTIGLLISVFLSDATKSITDILLASWVKSAGAFYQSSLFLNLIKNSLFALAGVFVTGRLSQEREIFNGLLTGVLFVTLFRLVPSLVEVALTTYYRPSFVQWGKLMQVIVIYIIAGLIVGWLGSFLARLTKPSRKVAD